MVQPERNRKSSFWKRIIPWIRIEKHDGLGGRVKGIRIGWGLNEDKSNYKFPWERRNGN